ncbi:serine/threonine-protein kinase 16-like [Amphiura filiformis]|uniref:serine/threonine-protein kinase 16-like n=1 Tax=Amphiura filiformis TaxID=82378 RepID=UPI003B224605
MGCYCTKETIEINGRRFYVQKRLGEGGFSVVDLVEDETGKTFAMKRILCHATEDEQMARQEAEFHQNFNHTNLIPLEEWKMLKYSGRVPEVVLVLPYYRGGTLQDEVERLAKQGEHMSEQRLMRIFKGICEGVRALHSASPEPLSHRDMKPGNVMLDDRGTPVIMDFGSMAVAKIEIKGRSQAVALQDTAAEKCSMLFRAPELFHVESHCIIDEKVDIWSLGCVLYTLAFLQSPFEPVYQRGDSLHLAVLGRNFKFPENSRYSEGLHDLVSSMLVVEPMERPSISWVMDRVDNLLQDLENRV